MGVPGQVTAEGGQGTADSLPTTAVAPRGA
jgi:hypothetical protein